jgi:hypothetical protein
MELNSVSFCICCNPSNTAGQNQTSGITTISNFNWVNLMGEMWYKYKRFNLTPCGVNCQAYSTLANYGIAFSGLPFINVVDTSTVKTNDIVDVGFAFNAQFPFAQAYSNSCSTMFERPPRTTDVTIRFLQRNGLTITTYPPTVIMFKITPVFTNEEIMKIPQTIYLQKTGVCFSLYSVDANATLDARGRVFQFNVDMRAVLGSLFGKYSRFILQTTKVNYIYNIAVGYDTQYAGVLYSAGIYLSGLDWVSTYDFPTNYGGQTLLANSTGGSGTLYTRKPPTCVAPYTYLLTNTGEFIMNVINKFEINTHTMADLIMYQGFNGTGDLLQMSTVTTTNASPFSVTFMIYGDEEFRLKN